MTPQSEFYGLLAIHIVIVALITISSKCMLNLNDNSSHPYMLSCLFFFSKALNLLVDFFSSTEDDTEKIIPIKDLIPDQSTSEITIPKIDYNNVDYTLMNTIDNQAERLPMPYSIMVFVAIVDIVNVTLSFYALKLTNGTVYSFIAMINVANIYALCYYNRFEKISKQMLIGNIISYLSIIAYIIYYLIIGDKKKLFGAILLFISMLISAIIFAMTNIFILLTYRVNAIKLNGVESVIAFFVYIILLICMTHISCDDPYKEYVCNGNSHMEEVGEFFSSETAKSGTKYLHMLIFVVCVCVYYAIEDNVRRNKLNSKIAFVGKELGVVLIVFIVMFLVPSGSIVPELAHEKINVVEKIIGIVLFIGVIISNEVVEMKFLKEKKEEGNMYDENKSATIN